MKFLSYFFTKIPGSDFNYYIPLLVVAVLLFLAGIVLKNLSSKNKALRRTLKKTPSHLTWLGIVLALLLAFRYEMIPYFSIRFFLFLTILLILFVVGKCVYLYVKVYPKELSNTEIPKETKKVYLPNKNKRK